MRKVRIVTDSCSDLPKELRNQYDIDYLKMNTVKDGEQTPASLDWEYYSPKELYDTIRSGKRVTTTQVPAPTFEEGFRKLLDEGCDIVYIACSGKLSGSVNTGEMVAQQLRKDYPDAKIHSIDSLNASGGEGLVAIRAAELRNQGLDADEIAAKIKEVRNNVNQFCAVHNLNALKAAGRVKASSAFFGNLLGVKPIIISDKDGNNTALKKVKGRLNSMEEIVRLTAEGIENPGEQTILVMHSDCEDEAQELVRMLAEAIPKAKTYVSYIGPIIGASIGADALAIFSWGKNVDRFAV